MSTLRTLTILLLSIAVAIWSIWLGWYGKPMIEQSATCCEMNQAQIKVLEAEMLLYEEQVKRLIAGNERLAQAVSEVKSRQPIKWRAK